MQIAATNIPTSAFSEQEQINIEEMRFIDVAVIMLFGSHVCDGDSGMVVADMFCNMLTAAVAQSELVEKAGNSSC
jgi:hypothetical protein